MACLLGDPSVTSGTVLHALKAYEAIRLPFANARVAGSRTNGMMYEFNSEYGNNLSTLGPAIEAQWDWLQETSLEEEVGAAIRELRKRVPATSERIAKL